MISWPTCSPADVLEETISVYFTVIQPWVPILHDTTVSSPAARSGRFSGDCLSFFIAIVVAALRFC